MIIIYHRHGEVIPTELLAKLKKQKQQVEGRNLLFFRGVPENVSEVYSVTYDNKLHQVYGEKYKTVKQIKKSVRNNK